MKAECFYFHMALFILEYTFSPNTPDIDMERLSLPSFSSIQSFCFYDLLFFYAPDASCPTY